MQPRPSRNPNQSSTTIRRPQCLMFGFRKLNKLKPNDKDSAPCNWDNSATRMNNARRNGATTLLTMHPSSSSSAISTKAMSDARLQSAPSLGQSAPSEGSHIIFFWNRKEHRGFGGISVVKGHGFRVWKWRRKKVVPWRRGRTVGSRCDVREVQHNC